MNIFKILMVDDDTDFVDLYRENLLALDICELAGTTRYDGIHIDAVYSQEEADVYVRDNQANIDLILLDLRYPVKTGDEPSENENQKSQAMIWLPELRKNCPYATIVILTAYPHEHDLKDAVSAVRDHGAGDFIPKTAQLKEVVLRISMALQKARQSRRLLRLDEEYHDLRRSFAARIHVEDIQALIDRSKATFYRIAREIETGVRSIIEGAPNAIREAFQGMQQSCARMTEEIANAKPSRHEINVVDTVNNLIQLYEDRLEAAGIVVKRSGTDGTFPVMTYESDVKVALHEVIVNAVDSLGVSENSPPGERMLEIAIEKTDHGFIVRVLDNGDGFSDESLQKMFHRGFSARKNESHLGMGLHIAKRMVLAAGGNVTARNRTDGTGAEVTLTIRDLRTS